jgi:hypothetical protein
LKDFFSTVCNLSRFSYSNRPQPYYLLTVGNHQHFFSHILRHLQVGKEFAYLFSREHPQRLEFVACPATANPERQLQLIEVKMLCEIVFITFDILDYFLRSS